MKHEKKTVKQRERRSFRVRKSLRGTAQRPRLSVFRSHKHVYAQLIDDSQGKTLASASTVDEDVRAGVPYGGNKGAAERVGKTLAQRALAAGIQRVCFDRGRFKFHGRVAALADAARAAGLEL